jgi:flagellar P-ring protein precursor FlgI
MVEVAVKRRVISIISLALIATCAVAHARDVRLKDIARVEGVRDNALTGYGIVIGLSGSGDSTKNRLTVQSVANALSHFGVNISPDDLSARNVAAVMVTAKLPAFAEPGRELDVEVSSIGDARSLDGGTLLLTPLDGPDGQLYALAQGAVSVGGYRVDSFGSRDQRNHPTVGRIPNGATVEREAPLGLTGGNRRIDVVLYQPDFITAQRVVDSLDRNVPGAHAIADNPGKITVRFDSTPASLVRAVAAIESVPVSPDQSARVVVNERTGTVVAGGDVQIGAVTVSQGDLNIQIQTDYLVSQPEGGYFAPSPAIATAVVPQSHIKVDDPAVKQVTLRDGTTVTELIAALRSIHLTTRDIISILQSIKAAGALRGELIIQ